MTTVARSSTESNDFDVIVVGSGLGGLVAGALMARYGQRVLVCESHSIAGGAAHGFVRRHEVGTFLFDSGPSFYCGLSDGEPASHSPGHPPFSANPITQVLAVLGESLEAVPYDPLGYYHFPEGTLPIYGDGEKYRQAVEAFSPGGAEKLAALEARLLKIYAPLKEIPTLALRADWKLLPLLLRHYPQAIAQLLPTLSDLGCSMAEVMDRAVPTLKADRWLKRLLDLECFLLSGMKCEETVAPEMAFMFGERAKAVVDYPIGGSGAIVDALVRGLEKWGGQLRLKAHVDQITVEKSSAGKPRAGASRVTGVRLKNGEHLKAPVVISNATLWDTYNQLLTPEDLPSRYRSQALSTPAVDSFMHLHLGIRADGLEEIPIHHVVVHDSDRDITMPGNTCMVSIPTVLDPQQAPSGYHTIHAYTLEPFENWTRWKDKSWRQDPSEKAAYEQQKIARAEPLFRALEKVIPDVRRRIVLQMIGTPLTHSRFLRRYQGTYGPAIAAKEGRFPGCKTPIQGLYRVGDSTLPGIGVPAVAASGILCANSLVPLKDNVRLLANLPC